MKCIFFLISGYSLGIIGTFFSYVQKSWILFLITHLSNTTMAEFVSNCYRDLSPRLSHYFKLPPLLFPISFLVFLFYIALGGSNKPFQFHNVRKRKWLFVNGCKCNSLIFTIMKFSDPCQDGMNVSICLGIMLKNYNSLE
jgi:hypothetical protein